MEKAEQSKAAKHTKTTESDSKPSAGGGVQSLHRAMSILKVVAHSREGVGLTDLCKTIGLHSSTTFHIAKTLVNIGLLRQDSESKRYRVGVQLFSLATGAFDEVELLSLASPFLRTLAESTGESSHLAVYAGALNVVIIDRVAGSASLQLTERIGTARPAHATAIGKVLMAGFPPEQLEASLSDCVLDAVTPKTITDVATLRQTIEDVKRDKIAFDDGEFDTEVRCLASPVFDFRGRMVAAIGISAPIWRLNMKQINDNTELVKHVARNFSLALGYQDTADKEC
ncbi:IclR family transcriptional regulator [Gibbsiella quercinecans]|uniref:HTH-type transcriptional repressor AllR n=1 Tax=Gibbsiella quercinecans TaxID=929813 RepID=A0A250B6H8_9GAMM|nr:IclR family transcriptional regulator [Gibbsiella quercinecans]ATA21721.1 hypothetical protein AWC35_21595 [Gibbsiella quercinecans]RLM02562.1 hypothetical protein BIY31_23445 [Gibbsiella quercinecans]RLM03757.1 hypothetical protein BIY30_21515 [Gibbsiella quercinecans]TCT88985.1 IclR family transcriptional regulator [Gibbsiella quercinecans]